MSDERVSEDYKRGRRDAEIASALHGVVEANGFVSQCNCLTCGIAKELLALRSASPPPSPGVAAADAALYEAVEKLSMIPAGRWEDSEYLPIRMVVWRAQAACRAARASIATPSQAQHAAGESAAHGPAGIATSPDRRPDGQSDPPALCADPRHLAAIALADQCIAQRDAPIYKTLTKGQRESMGITAKQFDDKLTAYRATLPAARPVADERDEHRFGSPRNEREALKDALGVMLIEANEGDNGLAPLRLMDDVLARLDAYVDQRIRAALSARSEGA